MKIKYAYLFVIAILILSCRQEEVETGSPVVTVDPPMEIESAFVQGQISDNEGALITSAVVQFYQNGELVGESMSDDNGFYNSSEIPLQEGQEVTLAVAEESYVAKYKRTLLAEGAGMKVDLRLVRTNGALPGQDQVLENPGDPTLIRLFGTLTDVMDAPISDAHVLLGWDFESPSESELVFKGAYDLTDGNGFVELLVPEGKEIFFLSVPSDFETGICIDYISEEEVNVLDFGLYFDALGVVTEEQELMEQEGLDFGTFSYVIQGDFKNCDGTPVSSGEVRMSVFYDDGSKTRNFHTTDFGPNGEFSFEFELCDYSGPLDLEMELVNQDTFGTQSLIQDVSFPGSQLGSFEACDDLRPVLLTSTLTLNIGADHSFDIVSVNPPFAFDNAFGFLARHEEISGFIAFQANDVELGDIVIDRLQVGWFANDPDPFSFSALGTLTADITQIADGDIIGTLQGDVETEGLGTQELTGDFVIRYQ